MDRQGIVEAVHVEYSNLREIRTSVEATTRLHSTPALRIPRYYGKELNPRQKLQTLKIWFINGVDNIN